MKIEEEKSEEKPEETDLREKEEEVEVPSEERERKNQQLKQTSQLKPPQLNDLFVNLSLTHNCRWQLLIIVSY